MNSVGSKVWDWHTAGEARTRACRAFPAGVVVFGSLWQGREDLWFSEWGERERVGVLV